MQIDVPDDIIEIHRFMIDVIFKKDIRVSTAKDWSMIVKDSMAITNCVQVR